MPGVGFTWNHNLIRAQKAQIHWRHLWSWLPLLKGTFAIYSTSVGIKFATHLQTLYHSLARAEAASLNLTLIPLNP